VTMIGVDIVDIARIHRIVERYGERFLDRVYSKDEANYARGKRRMEETLAGQFAAKEAFIKALGRGVPWRDIVVCHEGARPFIRFRGKRYDDVSISHEHAYAVAVVNINEEK